MVSTSARGLNGLPRCFATPRAGLASVVLRRAPIVTVAIIILSLVSAYYAHNRIVVASSSASSSHPNYHQIINIIIISITTSTASYHRTIKVASTTIFPCKHLITTISTSPLLRNRFQTFDFSSYQIILMESCLINFAPGQVSKLTMANEKTELLSDTIAIQCTHISSHLPHSSMLMASSCRANVSLIFFDAYC